MKATEQDIHVVMHERSIDKTLVCDHSNESYWAVLSCGAVFYAVQGGSNFNSVDETLVYDNWNVMLFIILYNASMWSLKMKLVNRVKIL